VATAPFNVQRDTILLSHANPEDNEFTLWLALQLANEGYKVWCDLTKLLGGEVFWDDIEAVLRQSAVKVLYVLSRSSNSKDGPLRELHLAQGLAKREKLKDFVIPLHIDDLPHGDVTIELTRVNSIGFEKSWAAGLASLLEKLELDGVPKSPSFDRAAVNQWWRSQFSASAGVRREEECYLSNWFPIVSLPPKVHFHPLSRRGIGKVEITDGLPYAGYQDGISLVTFAEASDFDDRLGTGLYIPEGSVLFDVAKLREESDFGKGLFRLLRMGWEQLITGRRFPVYELAGGAKTLYFTKDLIPSDKAFFTGVDGQKTYRSMVGYSTRKNPTTGESKKRFWHFGVQGRPLVHPVFPLAYVIKPHVLFSSDGSTLWESKKRLAAARRSQCKDWWNDVWRDRILAVMTQLADPDGIVRVPLGSNCFAEVSSTPCQFSSPVAYTDPQDLALSDEEDRPVDYGRETDEDDVFEDAPEAELR
jgi:hypothetical protein